MRLDGLVSETLFGDVAATINGRIEAGQSRSLLGLTADGALIRRRVDTSIMHLGVTLGGRIGGWNWSSTGNYDRTKGRTLTGTIGAPASLDKARADATAGTADVLLSGPLLTLPGGAATASIRGEIEFRNLATSSQRASAIQPIAIARDRGAIRGSVDVPLINRKRGGPRWIGNLSANANLELETLSDVGGLRTFGYGLDWTPSGVLSVIASVTNEQTAPTLDQLGAPSLLTPNFRTFDFTRRELVDITTRIGGNPDLRHEKRRVTRVGANLRPVRGVDLTVSIDYVKSRTDDPIVPFPVATPDIERAFPERFTRAEGGRLLAIDSRPLNFEQADQERVRYGLNLTRPLGPVPPELRDASMRFAASRADVERNLPSGAKLTALEAGSPAAQRFDNLTSRLFLSVYHSWYFTDDIIPRAGAVPLDLLNGGALDLRGGRRRHEIELQAGAFKRGLGGRIGATWQSGMRIRDLGGQAGDLDFRQIVTVNVNIFANLAERFGPTVPRWLKGTRASFSITNILDARPSVRDAAGSTPLGLQPAFLNPLGRIVSASLRKVF